MRLRFLGIGAIAAGLFAHGARAGDVLNIGDPAPKLAVSSWAKGEKVESFEPGKTYVVEFWATWCGPCIQSIPHLTELAHKYKDQGVRFVGVDVWENDTSQVEPFLKKMGDKMDYSVALDDVPKGGEPNDGAMAKTWMKAAEENGIPTAFVIRDGKIAWIGHPMSMDKPLEKIVAGDFDFKEMAETRLAAKVKQKKMAAVQQKVYGPYQAKDWKGTLAAIDEVTTSEPELAENFAMLRYAALCNSGKVDEGLAVGKALMAKYNDDGMALNNVFWNVIDPDLKGEPDPRVARQAMEALKRANELTKGEDMAVLDSYANALYLSGDAKGAVEAEEKAIKVLEKQTSDRRHPYFKQFAASLEKFKKAASK